MLIESGCDARYVPTGHLLFARAGSLFAVAFDLERLEVLGEPAPIASDVSMESFWAQAQVAVSDNGSFAYVSGGDVSVGRLAWVDRDGRTEFLPVPERLYGALDLAPGGERLAIHVGDVEDYIWIYDFRRQEGRRLTAKGNTGWPLWTRDARSVAYTAWRPGERWRMLLRPVDTSEEPEELLASAVWTVPWSWSPDSRVLAFSEGTTRMGFLPMSGLRQPAWLANEAFFADFSPDGRWVAYNSREWEVWVRPYPDAGTARQISTEGGGEPVWCEACDELFYWWGERWMSVTVTLEPDFAWEPPRLAFETDFMDTPGRSYDVSPDGQRLLVVKRTRTPTRTKIHLVQNWFEQLGSAGN